ncbi:GGDEF domain-containing protein [Marinomonas sp. 15G1-11]|uniref:diguanylate cyclase n=1 Tax=Marinomonas phaeophyticola TaxID=3004091 RepID=A0ABT4JVY3_9GAMM|nr:GGDEF domain-containing protein [Marinomonas sp. 15G1-11]MCZ2722541.1 GGDEF domain-containing protein [Marinomonas sp. 15G1-11]
MNSLLSVPASDLPKTLHKWLSGLVCGLHCFYFVLNMIFMQQMNLGAVQLLVACCSFYFFWVALKNRHYAWHRYMLMLLLTCNILASALIMGLKAGSIFWSFALPLWYYLLFGMKQGAVFTAIVAILFMVVLLVNPDAEMIRPYRTVLNFVLAYLSIWLVCHMYEIQRKKSHDILQRMALQDGLTGVQNRHALKADFNRINKQIGSTFMLLIDIDHFKRINDTFGHDVGDNVLIEVSNLIRNHVPSNNIYRLGGEEFVVLMENSHKDDAYRCAESVRALIENYSFYQKETNIDLTISIGIAPLSVGQDFTDFLRAADEKLYQAKNEGRNLVCK